jgi:EAL domain-containing protein (putative c-di-GMP-specific phosphodiesterase class I)
MAHDLRLSTVAEGVEHQEQLALLSSWNCDRIQGYLVSAPLPPYECLRRLASLDRV